MEIMLKVFNNVKDFYLSLDSGKKILSLALLFGIALSLVIVMSWIFKTRYEVLYTDLNKEDMKKIAVLLEENKISYKTSSDGRSISIPKEMVNKWRLEIATLGVNFSGTLGYEVFDNQSFGTTSFVQRINKQRALEGELVKTIRYIRGVKRARVHLSIPESSPFAENKKEPSASVVMELDRGVSLTEREVKGIAHLVSSSVEGMRTESVVILDDRGKKLSENVGDSMTAQTSNKMALEAKTNRRYEKQIEEILGKVVGNGKVIAKVSVNLDFTEKISTETSFDQENSAVISEVNNTQRLEGSRPSPQGIPGARSNLPGEEPQPGIPETRNNVNKSLVNKNYNVPSKVTKFKNPAAKIKNISVAVMVDGRRVASVDESGEPVLEKDGKVKMIYEPWSDSELENFSTVVSSAIGIKESRGDQLVIRNMEFAQEDFDSAEKFMEEKEKRYVIRDIVKYSTVGLTITLFFLLVVRPFIQWVTDNTVETVEDFLPKTLEELEKIQSNQKLPGLEDALPQMEEKLNPEKIEGNMLKEKIVSLVEGNPGKAAQILQEWVRVREGEKQR